MSSQPTVGRIVHYKSYGTPGGEYEPECRAALVTAVVDDENLSLAVVNPGGIFFDQKIAHSEEHRGGTWHWPCVQG